MSCNGCRVLRKGCSEHCILRPCLQWIDTAEAQGHATVFVAKFFGRAGLMSFISAVPENQRAALLKSLLFEAAGRTVNPVNGAVGLMWSGNWQVCQTAVDTVLRGGTLRPIPEFLNGSLTSPGSNESSEAEVTCTDMFNTRDLHSSSRSNNILKRRRIHEQSKGLKLADLDLSLTQGIPAKRSPGTPSRNSEESVTTTCFDSNLGFQLQQLHEPKLLNLFG